MTEQEYDNLFEFQEVTVDCKEFTRPVAGIMTKVKSRWAVIMDTGPHEDLTWRPTRARMLSAVSLKINYPVRKPKQED